MRKLLAISIAIATLTILSCKKLNHPALPPNNTDTTHNVAGDTIALSYWTTYTIFSVPINSYHEDSINLSANTAKWDSATNSLICEGDSAGNISKISVTFLQRPTSTKNYLLINTHWDGPLTDTNSCYITLQYINPVQPAPYFQSCDSGYYLQVIVLNNKLRIPLLPSNVTWVGNPHPLSPLERDTPSAIDDINLSGQLNER
jgi:hypothetical protein